MLLSDDAAPVEDSMKMIRNRSARPIRVPLPGGKTLHLGPGKEGQVSPQALNRPAVQALLGNGTIEVVGESAHGPGLGRAAASPHAETRGFRRTVTGFSKGDKRG